MHMFCFSGCGLWFKTSDSQFRSMSAISRSYNGPKYCCIRDPNSKITVHVMTSSAACPRRRNHRFIEHLQKCTPSDSTDRLAGCRTVLSSDCQTPVRQGGPARGQRTEDLVADT